MVDSDDYGGQRWRIVPGPQHLRVVPNAPEDPSSRKKHSFYFFDTHPESYESFLEFSFSGGYSRFGNERFSNQVVLAKVSFESGDTIEAPLSAELSLRPGFRYSLNATFHPHRYISHELGFGYNRSNLNIDVATSLLPKQRISSPADVRQFSYALQAHLRPNGKRFRPYLAAGAGFQMVRQTENSVQGHSLLKFSFKEVNVLYSAFRFGGNPPLEGGGIFQPTLNYGGGFRFYLTRHLIYRLDYRETLSRQPDFWTPSYSSFRRADVGANAIIEPGRLQRFGPLRQQSMSMGFGIAF